MPRRVRVLVFEDKPWWMQPLIHVPIVGDLSVRQLLFILAFTIPSLAVAVKLGLDTTMKLVVLLASATSGLALAVKPVKSIPPERQLLLALTGYKPGSVKEKPARTLTPKSVEAGVGELVVESRDPLRIPVVKIAGVLRDAFGNPVSNAELEVYVDGRLYGKARTGSTGEYLVYYTPSEPGSSLVEIRMGNQAVFKRRVTVRVKP